MHPIIGKVILGLTVAMRRTGRTQELNLEHLPGRPVIRVTPREARVYVLDPTPPLMDALVASGWNFCGVYES